MVLLLWLAFLPAVVLMIYIYRKDAREKEPVKLLAKLFLLGALSIIPAIAIELLLGYIFDRIRMDNYFARCLIENFIIVALTEEGIKYCILRKVTWNDSNYNYQFDAIVYAVFVSMGFAAFENVLYVINGGLETALMRAFLAVPLHAMSGVFMGYYYGMAKRCQKLKSTKMCVNLTKSLVVPVLLHGFYDFTLAYPNAYSIILFSAFVIIMYISAFRRVNKSSGEDSEIF